MCHQCRINLKRFLYLCQYSGVPIAPEKTVGPLNVLSFAGIELDTLHISPSNLGLFIAYMFQHQYAASTANTYVSALGYCHRLAGVHDPTKVFWVIEMLKGYGKLGSRVDTRLPITLPILRNITHQTSVLCSSQYRAYLFKAMCNTAFFAFLRIGEITVCPRSPTVLQLDQVVQLADHTGKFFWA